MKFISNKHIKHLMILALISSSLTFAFAADKTFSGKVIEISEEEDGDLKTTSYLKYPNAVGNWILWVIQPGVFVKEGTKLVHADTTYIDVNVKICEEKLKAQELILKYTKRDMDRQHKLEETKSVSEQTREQSEIAYYNAQIQYEIASQNLQNAKWDKIFADITAPYDCFIDKVYTKPGTISDIDYPILKIIRVSPLYIHVKMDRELAKKIYNQQVGVSVYPMDSDKAVGIFNEKVLITEEGIKMPVYNYLLNNFKEGIPVVHQVSYVASYQACDPDLKTKDLGILEHSIYKDEKGSYVWKAVGQTGMVPGKVIAREFPAEKIYVELTGQKREGFDGKLLQVKSDKLESRDVLLENVPKDLQSGTKVQYARRATLFWPGDTVKVIVHE